MTQLLESACRQVLMIRGRKQSLFAHVNLVKRSSEDVSQDGVCSSQPSAFFISADFTVLGKGGSGVRVWTCSTPIRSVRRGLTILRQVV